MKTSRLYSRIIAAALSAAAIISFASCGNVDPNVKQDVTEASTYAVATEAPTSGEDGDGFHAYGDGKTSPINLKGVKVDVEYFALRSYELAFMLAQDNFKSVDKLPVDALAQYGLTHVFYPNFYEIPNKAAAYRDAKLSEVKKALKKDFGKDDFDLKKSVLYNSKLDKFEMWVPNYGTNVYYRVDTAEAKGSKAEIATTFYKDMKKSVLLGRTTLTVELKNNKPVITKLSTKN